MDNSDLTMALGDGYSLIGGPDTFGYQSSYGGPNSTQVPPNTGQPTQASQQQGPQVPQQPLPPHSQSHLTPSAAQQAAYHQMQSQGRANTGYPGNAGVASSEHMKMHSQYPNYGAAGVSMPGMPRMPTPGSYDSRYDTRHGMQEYGASMMQAGVGGAHGHAQQQVAAAYGQQQAQMMGQYVGQRMPAPGVPGRQMASHYGVSGLSGPSGVSGYGGPNAPPGVSPGSSVSPYHQQHAPPGSDIWSSQGMPPSLQRSGAGYTQHASYGHASQSIPPSQASMHGPRSGQQTQFGDAFSAMQDPGLHQRQYYVGSASSGAGVGPNASSSSIPNIPSDGSYSGPNQGPSPYSGSDVGRQQTASSRGAHASLMSGPSGSSVRSQYGAFNAPPNASPSVNQQQANSASSLSVSRYPQQYSNYPSQPYVDSAPSQPTQGPGPNSPQYPQPPMTRAAFPPGVGQTSSLSPRRPTATPPVGSPMPMPATSHTPTDRSNTSVTSSQSRDVHQMNFPISPASANHMPSQGMGMSGMLSPGNAGPGSVGVSGQSSLQQLEQMVMPHLSGASSASSKSSASAVRDNSSSYFGSVGSGREGNSGSSSGAPPSPQTAPNSRQQSAGSNLYSHYSSLTPNQSQPQYPYQHQYQQQQSQSSHWAGQSPGGITSTPPSTSSSNNTHGMSGIPMQPQNNNNSSPSASQHVPTSSPTVLSNKSDGGVNSVNSVGQFNSISYSSELNSASNNKDNSNYSQTYRSNSSSSIPSSSPSSSQGLQSGYNVTSVQASSNASSVNAFELSQQAKQQQAAQNDTQSQKQSQQALVQLKSPPTMFDTLKSPPRSLSEQMSSEMQQQDRLGNNSSHQVNNHQQQYSHSQMMQQSQSQHQAYLQQQNMSYPNSYDPNYSFQDMSHGTSSPYGTPQHADNMGMYDQSYSMDHPSQTMARNSAANSYMSNMQMGDGYGPGNDGQDYAAIDPYSTAGFDEPYGEPPTKKKGKGRPKKDPNEPKKERKPRQPRSPRGTGRGRGRGNKANMGDRMPPMMTSPMPPEFDNNFGMPGVGESMNEMYGQQHDMYGQPIGQPMPPHMMQQQQQQPPPPQQQGQGQQLTPQGIPPQMQMPIPPTGQLDMSPQMNTPSVAHPLAPLMQYDNNMTQSSPSQHQQTHLNEQNQNLVHQPPPVTQEQQLPQQQLLQQTTQDQSLVPPVPTQIDSSLNNTSVPPPIMSDSMPTFSNETDLSNQIIPEQVQMKEQIQHDESISSMITSPSMTENMTQSDNNKFDEVFGQQENSQQDSELNSSIATTVDDPPNSMLMASEDTSTILTESLPQNEVTAPPLSPLMDTPMPVLSPQNNATNKEEEECFLGDASLMNDSSFLITTSEQNESTPIKAKKKGKKRKKKAEIVVNEDEELTQEIKPPKPKKQKKRKKKGAEEVKVTEDAEQTELNSELLGDESVLASSQATDVTDQDVTQEESSQNETSLGETATPSSATSKKKGGKKNTGDSSTSKPKRPKVKNRSPKKKLPKLALKFSKNKKRKRGLGGSSDNNSDIEKTPPPSPDEAESGILKRRSARNTTKVRQKYTDEIDLDLSDDDEKLSKKNGNSSGLATPIDGTGIVVANVNEDTMVVEKIMCSRMAQREVEVELPEGVEPDPEAKPPKIEVEEFYVKYKNLSYLHCDWKTEEELERGDRRVGQKVKRFKQKKDTLNMFDFLDEEPYNPDYVEVDRILDVNEVEEIIYEDEEVKEEKKEIKTDEIIQNKDQDKDKDKLDDNDIKTEETVEKLIDGQTDETKTKENDKNEEKCEEDEKKESQVEDVIEEVRDEIKNDIEEDIKKEVKVKEEMSEKHTEEVTETKEKENVEEGEDTIKSMDVDINESEGVKEGEKSDEMRKVSSNDEEKESEKKSDNEEKLEKTEDNGEETEKVKEEKKSEVEKDEEQEVEKDIPERPKKTRIAKHYLVKWKALAYEDSTWELEDDLDVTKIQQFYRFRLPPPKNKWKPVKRPKAADWKKIEESPEYNSGNVLREYQLEGLNWLTFCWYNNQNCILADEMGLGKTIQSIAYVNEIVKFGIPGPFLVIAPLSTIGNWQREFETWTDINVITYHGSSASRNMIQEYEMYYRNDKGERIPGIFKFQVMITTFEMVLNDCLELREIYWKSCIIDEAHRLKNRNCKLLEGLKLLNVEHRVLLTGTPLQNNVEELFSLLNFLEPTQFISNESFMLEFGDLKSETQVDKLKAILKPMMLRRLKEDVEKSLAPKEETIVEVELTNSQKKYYRAILERNFAFLSKGGSYANTPNLMNTMMELRKCCIHPFLINGAEEQIMGEHRAQHGNMIETHETTLQAIVQASGKLVLIDKLLPRLRESGHRVLIFSQMVRCLDILEDYMVQKKYPYERIDGRVRGNLRQAAIDRFSKPDSDRFVFLLCTRAGGLGINLTAADTVIIFDSDWNPQNDLQAQARCHRIGQSKSVKVYRLICRNTYEREMFDRASLKLGLDRAVLQSLNSQKALNDTQMSKKEIEDLLRKGAYGALMDEDNDGDKFCEEDIEQILQRRTKIVTIESEGKGSTFSKASFASSHNRSDIEIDDPNFWEKWAKKANFDVDELKGRNDLIVQEPRRRTQTKRFGADDALVDMSELESSDEDEDSVSTRTRGGARGRLPKGKKGKKGRGGGYDRERDEDYMGDFGPGNWSRAECFKVEKGLLTFGWGRWDEILIMGNFRRRLTRQDVEDTSRVLLLYALQNYKGDEKIKSFIWDLIHPFEEGENKLNRNHSGLSAPVPRGRKNKKLKKMEDEETSLDWAKDEKYNPEVLLTDDTYKKHLLRHANKILLRVRLLYYLKQEIIGELHEQVFAGISAKDIPIPSPDCEGEPPAPWWDEEADKSLIIGIYKHGYDRFNLMRQDAALCFLTRCGPPDGAALLAEMNSEDDLNKTLEEDEEPETPATPATPSNNDNNSAAANESAKNIIKADKPDDKEKETDKEKEKESQDVETHESIFLPFPSTADMNQRLRRMITGYQRSFKKQEMKMAQRARHQQRLERLEKFEAAIKERESKKREMAQKKWSRREEADFYRVVSSYGVEYDKESDTFNWDKFRSFGKLERKLDETLTEYYKAFYAMCKRVTGKRLTEEEENLPISVDSISEERASRSLARIDLLNKIREEILPHPELDERLNLCQMSIDLPDWWVCGKHDKDLLVGASKYGLNRLDFNLMHDQDLSFYEIVKAHEQDAAKQQPLTANKPCCNCNCGPGKSAKGHDHAHVDNNKTQEEDTQNSEVDKKDEENKSDLKEVVEENENKKQVDDSQVKETESNELKEEESDEKDKDKDKEEIVEDKLDSEVTKTEEPEVSNSAEEKEIIKENGETSEHDKMEVDGDEIHEKEKAEDQEIEVKANEKNNEEDKHCIDSNNITDNDKDNNSKEDEKQSQEIVPDEENQEKECDSIEEKVIENKEKETVETHENGVKGEDHLEDVDMKKESKALEEKETDEESEPKKELKLEEEKEKEKDNELTLDTNDKPAENEETKEANETTSNETTEKVVEEEEQKEQVEKVDDKVDEKVDSEQKENKSEENETKVETITKDETCAQTKESTEAPILTAAQQMQQTKHSIRWPKDRVLQMRLEQICHTVEKNEWPSMRHTFFSLLTGPLPSTPSNATADSSPSRPLSPCSLSSASREPTPHPTPEQTPRRETMSPALPDFYYPGDSPSVNESANRRRRRRRRRFEVEAERVKLRNLLSQTIEHQQQQPQQSHQQSQQHQQQISSGSNKKQSTQSLLSNQSPFSIPPLFSLPFYNLKPSLRDELLSDEKTASLLLGSSLQSSLAAAAAAVQASQASSQSASSQSTTTSASSGPPPAHQNSAPRRNASLGTLDLTGRFKSTPPSSHSHPHSHTHSSALPAPAHKPPPPAVPSTRKSNPKTGADVLDLSSASLPTKRGRESSPAKRSLEESTAAAPQVFKKQKGRIGSRIDALALNLQAKKMQEKQVDVKTDKMDINTPASTFTTEKRKQSHFLEELSKHSALLQSKTPPAAHSGQSSSSSSHLTSKLNINDTSLLNKSSPFASLDTSKLPPSKANEASTIADQVALIRQNLRSLFEDHPEFIAQNPTMASMVAASAANVFNPNLSMSQISQMPANTELLELPEGRRRGRRTKPDPSNLDLHNLTGDENISVINKTTGKKITGAKAPPLKHLAEWLDKNPKFDVDPKFSPIIKEKAAEFKTPPASHHGVRTRTSDKKLSSSSSHSNPMSSSSKRNTAASLLAHQYGNAFGTPATSGMLNFPSSAALNSLGFNASMLAGFPQMKMFMDPTSGAATTSSSSGKNSSMTTATASSTSTTTSASNAAANNPFLFPFGGLAGLGMGNPLFGFPGFNLPGLSHHGGNNPMANFSQTSDNKKDSKDHSEKSSKSEKSSNSKSKNNQSNSSSSNLLSSAAQLGSSLPFLYPSPNFLYNPLLQSGLGGFSMPPFSLSPSSLMNGLGSLSSSMSGLNTSTTTTPSSHAKTRTSSSRSRSHNKPSQQHQQANLTTSSNNTMHLPSGLSLSTASSLLASAGLHPSSAAAAASAIVDSDDESLKSLMGQNNDDDDLNGDFDDREESEMMMNLESQHKHSSSNKKKVSSSSSKKDRNPKDLDRKSKKSNSSSTSKVTTS